MKLKIFEFNYIVVLSLLERSLNLDMITNKLFHFAKILFPIISQSIVGMYRNIKKFIKELLAIQSYENASYLI